MLLTPLTTVAALLVLAGAAKLRTPQTAAAALAHGGLPVRGLAVRLIGGLEVGLGLAAIGVPSPALAVAIAGAYASFAVVTVRLLRAGEQARCGCFGARSSPVHPIHLALNLTGVAVATAAALTPVGTGLPAVVFAHPAGGAILAASAAAATVLAHQAYVAVPALWSAWTAARPPAPSA